jgi:hypothetical protein
MLAAKHHPAFSAANIQTELKQKIPAGEFKAIKSKSMIRFNRPMVNNYRCKCAEY